jgi:hypothetical protein
MQGAPDLADRGVDGGWRVKKDVLTPNSPYDLFAGYQFPSPFD